MVMKVRRKKHVSLGGYDDHKTVIVIMSHSTHEMVTHK